MPPDDTQRSLGRLEGIAQKNSERLTEIAGDIKSIHGRLGAIEKRAFFLSGTVSAVFAFLTTKFTGGH